MLQLLAVRDFFLRNCAILKRCFTATRYTDETRQCFRGWMLRKRRAAVPCSHDVNPGRLSLSRKASKPTSKSARRGDGDAHPVLARLPDVSGQPIKARSARAAAAGFVDYRFDQAVGVEDDPARRKAQPHVFQRSPRSEYRTRPFGSPSRVLPDSNPFSIPAASLLDKLAPVGHFAVLFVLFTAAGTFLMSGRRGKSTSEATRPRGGAATAPEMRQSLEPAPNIDHPTIATPTAFGPLGAAAKPTIQIELKLAEAAPQSAIENSPPVEVAPTPMLARADGEPLPQVQTTEPLEDGGGDAPARLEVAESPSETDRAEESSRSPSVATLPGVIFEAPRQAYHDTNQPGLH